MAVNTQSENLNNAKWRLYNLYKIIDKDAKKITFYPNIVQRAINQSKRKRKMILKPRQLGVSTNELIKLADSTFFKSNQTNVIIAHEQGAIEKLFRIPKRCYDFMDPTLRPKLAKGGGSKYEMYFPANNSRIYCDLEVRGDTIQRLHISEAAFIKDRDRIIATLEAVPMDGMATMETTANGMGNYFHDSWFEDNNWEKIFFPWFIFPENKIINATVGQWTSEELEVSEKAFKYFKIKLTSDQIGWRRFKKSDLKEKFKQEHPEDEISCFLTDGQNVFDLMKLMELKKKLPDPINSDGCVKIWKRYQKDHIYVIGADTAEGVGGDYSVAEVYDAITREQVAQIRTNKLKPSDFADKIVEVAKLYHMSGRTMPLLAVERNNHGHAVLQQLEEVEGYENLYYYVEEKRGWLTDKITRPIMLNDFHDSVENQTIKLNSHTTLDECLTLVNNNGKVEAAKGKHDDCIIASSIAVQMIKELRLNNELYNDIENKILL